MDADDVRLVLPAVGELLLTAWTTLDAQTTRTTRMLFSVVCLPAKGWNERRERRHEALGQRLDANAALAHLAVEDADAANDGHELVHLADLFIAREGDERLEPDLGKDGLERCCDLLSAFSFES